jgi:inner membrane protein
LDPFTHALSGVCISRALPRSVRGRDATIVVVAAALIPDIDVVWSLAEPATAALNRHMATHSLVGLAALSMACGVVARLAFRRLSWATYAALAGFGLLAHVGLDLVNAFGVGLLYPFSPVRYELPLVFVVDFVLTGLMLAGAIWPWVRGDASSAAPASRWALGLVAVYLAASLGLRVSAAEIVTARASAAAPDGGAWTYLVPEPGAPLRWKGIYRDGPVFRQVLVSPLTGGAVELPAIGTLPEDPSVAAVRATPMGRRIDRFLKAPVWRAEKDMVTVYDLRFRFAALGNDWDPFGFRFRREGDAALLVRDDAGTYLGSWLQALRRLGGASASQP